MTAPKADPRVTKRRVTSTTYNVTVDESGAPVTHKHEVVDYVRPDFLDAYLAAQHAAGWQTVNVSDEPDAGPGGYDGSTYVPATLDHPLAGTFFDGTASDVYTQEDN